MLVILCSIELFKGPSFLELLPGGEYLIEETGCFNKRTGEFTSKTKGYFEKFPPIDHPDLALAHLDFDNVSQKKIKVSSAHVWIGIKNAQCEYDALYKIKSNSNKQLVLHGDRIITEATVDNCSFQKKIENESIEFDRDFFFKRGLFFSFEVFLQLEFKMTKVGDDFFLIFSEKNYLESTYFESLDEVEDDNVQEEYLDFCPNAHALSWKLKRS